MALADAAIWQALQQSGNDKDIALRLAIREVLAERDFMKHAATDAVRECERLRELIAELDGHEGAEGWSEGMRERIDAALKDQP